MEATSHRMTITEVSSLLNSNTILIKISLNDLTVEDVVNREVDLHNMVQIAGFQARNILTLLSLNVAEEVVNTKMLHGISLEVEVVHNRS